jgi:hypothetical protein
MAEAILNFDIDLDVALFEQVVSTAMSPGPDVSRRFVRRSLSMRACYRSPKTLNRRLLFYNHYFLSFKQYFHFQSNHL